MSKVIIEFPDRELAQEFMTWLFTSGEREYLECSKEVLMLIYNFQKQKIEAKVVQYDGV